MKFMRTFDDDARATLAVRDRDRCIGPLETTGCSHGQPYSFRHEWDSAAGTPAIGVIRIVENDCPDCCATECLRPGTVITL